jgi:hypothetical protein
MTGRLNQLLISFDFLFSCDENSFMITHVKFKKDVEKWVKKLISEAKEWLAADSNISEKDHEAILNMLNTDFFDENNIVDCQYHTTIVPTLAYTLAPKNFIFIWFFNKRIDGEGVNQNLDSFDSIKIFFYIDNAFVFEILDKCNSKRIGVPLTSNT